MNQQPVESEIAGTQETFKALDGGADADGTGDVGAIEKLVASGGLAGFAGALQNVFKVVDCLVAETPADGDALEQLDFACRRATEHGGDNEGETNQRDGFAARNPLSGFTGMREGCVMEIEALAVEQAFDAETLFDVVRDVTVCTLRTDCDGAPDKSVGAIDKSKSGEDRRGFAEFDVDTGSAAALDGVVHAGQVVEDQRGSVEVLEGDGEVVGGLGVKIVGRAHAKHHAWPDHAAGIREHVVQGAVKAGIEKRRKRQRSAKRFLQ